MKAFITRRIFYVRATDRCSFELEVTSGVTQGSVLGSFLFLLLIKDLASDQKSPSFFFADDVKMAKRPQR